MEPTPAPIMSLDVYELKCSLLPPAESTPESVDIHLSDFYDVSFPKCQGLHVIGGGHTVFYSSGSQQSFRFQLSRPGGGASVEIINVV